MPIDVQGYAGSQPLPDDYNTGAVTDKVVSKSLASHKAEDAIIDVIAHKMLAELDKAYGKVALRSFILPEGTKVSEGIRAHIASYDISRIIAKPGNFEKWMTASSKRIMEEINLERLQEKQNMYRAKIKTRFLDLLNELEQKNEVENA